MESRCGGLAVSGTSTRFRGMSASVLTRDDAFQRIRAAEPRIRGLGVRRLALFGSVLRDEARPDSDVDLLVQFEPGQKTFRRFTELYDLMEEIFDRKVELLTTESLSPFIGPRILAEAADVIPTA
jgi:predicted nucleotidyltransferase